MFCCLSIQFLHTLIHFCYYGQCYSKFLSRSPHNICLYKMLIFALLNILCSIWLLYWRFILCYFSIYLLVILFNINTITFVNSYFILKYLNVFNFLVFFGYLNILFQIGIVITFKNF